MALALTGYPSHLDCSRLHNYKIWCCFSAGGCPKHLVDTQTLFVASFSFFSFRFFFFLNIFLSFSFSLLFTFISLSTINSARGGIP